MRPQKPVKFTCPECGSEEITFKGYMVWDKENQRFECDEVDWDHYPYCRNCDTELYDPEVREEFLSVDETIALGLIPGEEVA